MTARSLKQVLVTGGAGFIGSNIARLVGQQTGARVVVLDNLSSGHRSNLDGLPVTFVEGDLCDAAAVRRAIEGCDTVFHLAASVGNSRSIENPDRDSEVNVLGTLRVLEAALEAGGARSSTRRPRGSSASSRRRPFVRITPSILTRRTARASSPARSCAWPTRSCIPSRRSACATSTCTV